MKKSFANRLILNFTCVVFLGFLVVYFLFNFLIDTHIRQVAETELNREVMTIQENEFFDYIPLVGFDGYANFQIRTNRIQRNIVNVDTIIIDEHGIILHPHPQNLSESESEMIKALATFWLQNQSAFEVSDDMIMTAHHGHTFYMRATPHYFMQSHSLFLETLPVSVLMYTDITPAMNLKSSMNQILLALLATSGTLTLAISILLSTRFKQTIKRLSNHAEIIGQGNFNEKITDLSYSEFETLGASMNTMANMLGTYETNQKQFFQNASHELRTPLMSIQGYAEALQSNVFENDFASEIILEESKKMTTLINDILYLSKLNLNENIQLDLQLVTVADLIGGCAKRVQILAQKENKSLLIDKIAKITIETDQDKLERAIINILSNAIRYAHDEIRINCDLKTDQLIITIANDGDAIDPGDLPHIFDRFYKGHNGNTGLGLAITKDIITKLGGTITCENLNQGVQFIICLPIK